MDLFAGPGGSTSGLKQAGFRVLGALECDPDSTATYAANHGEVALIDEETKQWRAQDRSHMLPRPIDTGPADREGQG